MIDLSWWTEPESAHDALSQGIGALGELARIESSAELPAVISSLTRAQVEALALAGVFDRVRHTSSTNDYMAWSAGGED